MTGGDRWLAGQGRSRHSLLPSWHPQCPHLGRGQPLATKCLITSSKDVFSCYYRFSCENVAQFKYIVQNLFFGISSEKCIIFSVFRNGLHDQIISQ